MFAPAAVACIDRELAENHRRYRAALTADHGELAAAYWADFDKLLDRRLALTSRRLEPIGDAS